MSDTASDAYHFDPAGAPAEPGNAQRSGRIGVLLVNLGTPSGTGFGAVRRYLKEFLSDRRVIEDNSLSWKLVFYGIVLTIRPWRKGKDYARIWNRERNESPLMTITRAQALRLQAMVADVDSRLVVDWAMRYGSPSIASRIESLATNGCDRILLVPLYPQYSAATTATVCDEAFRALMRMRRQPSIRVAPPYYDDPDYIEAVAASIHDELAKSSFEPDAVVASFHGIPVSYAQKGDPYPQHCVKTARLLREAIKLPEDKFVLTFQSRFGRAEWLQPYTDKTIARLARQGAKTIAVVTPGFAADCLETLEEIAVENAHIFRKAGGKTFIPIPCLNDSERGMALIKKLVLRELAGWL